MLIILRMASPRSCHCFVHIEISLILLSVLFIMIHVNFFIFGYKNILQHISSNLEVTDIEQSKDETMMLDLLITLTVLLAIVIVSLFLIGRAVCPFSVHLVNIIITFFIARCRSQKNLYYPW